MDAINKITKFRIIYWNNIIYIVERENKYRGSFFSF